MINRFYLKGAGKKSRRKSKKKSDITPEETVLEMTHTLPDGRVIELGEERLQEHTYKEGKNFIDDKEMKRRLEAILPAISRKLEILKKRLQYLKIYQKKLKEYTKGLKFLTPKSAVKETLAEVMDKSITAHQWTRVLHQSALAIQLQNNPHQAELFEEIIKIARDSENADENELDAMLANAKDQYREGLEKSNAVNEELTRINDILKAKESESIEDSIDKLTFTEHERDFWNKSHMKEFREQRARAKTYANSWENTKFDSRIHRDEFPPPPSSSEDEDEEDESKGWEESKNDSTGGAPYALSYYLQGSGKKSRRKTKESRTENTLATQSEGVDHFILIKIISLLRKEKNAPDDKLVFLLQDLAENGIRVDNAHFHLRFNNGEPLNKKELIKMLQKARVRFIEPVIHHILNALDDIVVKVKDIDSKTEIEYLELLYSPQNMAVYFNIEKSFNELKLESHKLNLGILLHRTLLEYLRLFNEELDKLLKIDIEQMVSVDTQRAHKASNRLYRGHEKDQKSWHGFPVQQQASFEAAIAKEILQDTDSKGELLLSSTLEHYLKRNKLSFIRINPICNEDIIKKKLLKKKYSPKLISLEAIPII